MRIHTNMKLIKIGLLLSSIFVFNAVAVASDAPENFKLVDGVGIYLGVIPAEILLGYRNEHVEQNMHGGVPGEGHRDHVVIALFDHATGKRIENAKVTGSVMELGLGGEKKVLDAMKISDTITYGNYFHMPNNKAYHIKLWISLHDTKRTIEATFTHRHSR